MPNIREGNKYYTEEEHKKLKQTQSKNAVIILFAFYGAAGGYALGYHLEFSKILTFLSIIIGFVILGYVAILFSKYIVLLFRGIAYSLVIAAIGALIWFNI